MGISRWYHTWMGISKWYHTWMGLSKWYHTWMGISRCYHTWMGISWLYRTLVDWSDVMPQVICLLLLHGLRTTHSLSRKRNRFVIDISATLCIPFAYTPPINTNIGDAAYNSAKPHNLSQKWKWKYIKDNHKRIEITRWDHRWMGISRWYQTWMGISRW